jgi:hypothetical protein
VRTWPCAARERALNVLVAGRIDNKLRAPGESG